MTSSDPVPPAEPTARRRRVGLLAGVALVAAAADIVSKVLVVAHLTPGDSPRFLGGLVYFSLIRNPGAAFGIASGMTFVFAIIAAVAIVAIARMASRLRSVAWAVGLGLLLGGTTGNLGDRLFRAPGFLRGHVVDFVSVFGPDARYFPAFNLADAAITVGVAILVVATLFGVDLDGHRHRKRD
ncbi:signal peptidase II [Longispora sp. K20-0274]|uniref:signal peptidase II n=1 Tax=Longispora sp. K20-0274 TaxID=3088255 RepID=UPI00399A0F39